MTSKKRAGFTERLLEESARINEGLKELDLVQDPEDEDEISDVAKEAYLMRELERKDQEIRDLTAAQNELLEQLEEFEKENLNYRQEIERLQDDALVKDEAKADVAASDALGISKAKKPVMPDVDLDALIKDLKTYSPLLARGSVSHSVSELSYNQMRDIMRHLEDLAPIKRIREAEFWNVSIWLMYSIFQAVKDLPSVDEMAGPLKSNTDATEVLLQYYLIMLAHLGIEKA